MRSLKHLCIFHFQYHSILILNHISTFQKPNRNTMSANTVVETFPFYGVKLRDLERWLREKFNDPSITVKVCVRFHYTILEMILVLQESVYKILIIS